jgi:hypothetical protein
MSYGMIFWVNSSHSSVIFKMQNMVIRIIMGCGYRESCRELFNELKILPHSSQNVFSLLLFVVNIMDYFMSNSVCHNSNTGQKNNLHLPYVILPMYQKEVYYSSFKNFNGLPKAIKDISSNHKFKVALKHFLHTH